MKIIVDEKIKFILGDKLLPVSEAVRKENFWEMYTTLTSTFIHPILIQQKIMMMKKVGFTKDKWIKKVVNIVDTEYEMETKQQQEEGGSIDKLLSFINDREQKASEDDSDNSDFEVEVTVDVDPIANSSFSTPKNINISKNRSGLKRDFQLDLDIPLQNFNVLVP